MEYRICPICLNKIPIYARFLCPSCHFELKWLENDKMIEIAKKNFTGRLYTVENQFEVSLENDDHKHSEGYQQARKVYRWLW